MSEILMNIGDLRKKLAAKTSVSQELKVEFSNPVTVYARDMKRPATERPDEDMELGTAFVRIDGDQVLGDVTLHPWLQDFYDANPRFRPRYTAIGSLAHNGETVDCIVIQWIGAR